MVSLYNQIYPRILNFPKLVNNLKLKLFPKEVVVASHPELGKKLQIVLKQNGVVYQTQNQTRDLGITYASGKSRSTHLLVQRINKTKPRNKIIK